MTTATARHVAINFIVHVTTYADHWHKPDTNGQCNNFTLSPWTPINSSSLSGQQFDALFVEREHNFIRRSWSSTSRPDYDCGVSRSPFNIATMRQGDVLMRLRTSTLVYLPAYHLIVAVGIASATAEISWLRFDLPSIDFSVLCVNWRPACCSEWCITVYNNRRRKSQAAKDPLPIKSWHALLGRLVWVGSQFMRQADCSTVYVPSRRMFRAL
jgi:hypothetical protein